MKLFETIECQEIGIETDASCKFSAICDDDGHFTVTCEGTGGKDGLLKFVDGIRRMIENK